MGRLTMVLTLVLIILLAFLADGRTIVVDQEGKGDFKSIGIAVTYAMPEDLISVVPGSYMERLILNKTVTINGNGARVSGRGSTVLMVNAPGCNLSDLILESSGEQPAVVLKSGNNNLSRCQMVDCNIGLEVGSSNNTLIENQISALVVGMNINGTGHLVKGNAVTGSLRSGIVLTGCRGCRVVDNLILRSTTGIYLDRSQSNLIANNTLNSSHSQVGQRPAPTNGLDLVTSSRNRVENNSISGSKVGLRVKDGPLNLLSGNICFGNEVSGIYLENTTGNDVADNLLTGNGNGLMLKSSWSNNLTGNNASVNTYGITLKASPYNLLRDNVMEKNTFNLQVVSAEEPRESQATSVDYYQDIDSTNLADGGAICYLVGARDLLLDGGCGLVVLIDCRNVTVLDHTIANSSAAVQMVNATLCRVEGCHLSKSEAGVSILASRYCTISNSTSRDCQSGFLVSGSQDVALRDNRASLSEIGYRVEWSHRTVLKSSQAMENRDGIYIVDSPSSDISGCILSQNSEVGLRMIRSKGGMVRDNQLIYNRLGALISGSAECTLLGNNISSNNESGVEMDQLTGGQILNNTAKGNREGVFIMAGREVQVEGNILSKNRYGLRMSSSSSCTVAENRIMQNEMAGVSLTDCNDNRIYHNIFVENGKPFGQQAVDNSNNQWDMGPQVGGNYWSDHLADGNPGGQQRKIPSQGVDRYPFRDPKGWLVR